MKNILLLGSGGREMAMAYSIRKSPQCGQLYIAPGNAGTASIGQNVALHLADFPAIEKWVNERNIDFIVVGPEQPLADGIADYFAGKNIPVLGPSRAGAMLESSKAFAKEFMLRHSIPTAAYKRFESNQIEEAAAYVRSHALPVVVKASGLAAGKGVIIAGTHAEAEAAVRDMLGGGAFGDAGATVVIEQFLTGTEVSMFILTDGSAYVLLPHAKDYKRIGEGDTGPNTGGMGAVYPVPFVTAEFTRMVTDRIIRPTLDGLQKEEIPYTGFIFFGLIVVNGDPYVIEYNCRMGDPETEVVFPLIESDVVEMFDAALKGNLSGYTVRIRDAACATVMLVSGGYPGDYAKGKVMTGMESVEGSILFHAGTTVRDGQTVTSGGRVIAVTSFGRTIAEAVEVSLANAERIQFEGRYFRRDIGRDVSMH